MIINTKELLNAVRLVSRFTRRMPDICEMLRIEAANGTLTVGATDLDMRCVVKIQMGKNVILPAMLVNAQRFAAFLGTVKDEDVSLTDDRNRLVVSASAASGRLAASLDVKRMPSLEHSEIDAPAYTFEASHLRDALHLCGFAADNEKLMVTAAGVANIKIFTNLIESKFEMAATNRHVLSVVNGLCEKSEGLEDTDFQIPKTAIVRLLQALPAQGQVNVVVNKKDVDFHFDTTTISVRRPATGFPRYETVSEKEFPLQITTNADDLRSSVRSSMTFSPITSKKTRLTIEDGEIRVASRDGSLGEFEDRVECSDIGELIETSINHDYFNEVLSRVAGDVTISFLPQSNSYALRVETPQKDVKAQMVVQCLQEVAAKAAT